MLEIRIPRNKREAYIYGAGNEIKKGCKKNKITYSELADHMGVILDNLNNWVENKTGMPLEEFNKFMRICGIEEKDLNINDRRQPEMQSKEKKIRIRWSPLKKMDYVYNAGGGV
jgi:transcriptional regulator with XRE-family HTH domain